MYRFCTSWFFPQIQPYYELMKHIIPFFLFSIYLYMRGAPALRRAAIATPNGLLCRYEYIIDHIFTSQLAIHIHMTIIHANYYVCTITSKKILP
jgi:hypothetical protein